MLCNLLGIELRAFHFFHPPSDLQHASFSHFQEQYWRSIVFHNHVDYLSKNGYEVDENARSQSVKEQQELLMKLFAVSTNTLKNRIPKTSF